MPAGQSVAHASAPMGDDPEEQSKQAVVAVAPLYFPATHSVHAVAPVMGTKVTGVGAE